MVLDGSAVEDSHHQQLKFMKTHHIQWLLALVASVSAYAKPPQDREHQRPPMPPAPPLFAILDTDHNGALSDEEIKGAANILAKLDKNGDGEVTLEELRMPPPPPRQDADGPIGPPPEGRRPVPPLIAAIDADHDGNVSSQEIENSPEALQTLDKNGDGALSPEELRPSGPPPERGEGPQGPPPQGEPGGAE